jgi:hypothetical protein
MALSSKSSLPSDSEMHCCLEIPEILKSIFDNLDYSARRRSLYALHQEMVTRPHRTM